jgi:hypothetical protein
MVLLCGFYLICAVFRTEYAGNERFTLKYASTDDASDVVPRPKAEDGSSRSEHSVSPGGHFRGTVGPESIRFYNPHYQRQTRSMDSIVLDPGLCQGYHFLSQQPPSYWMMYFQEWLRSKCSICFYQLNIGYVPHWGTSILN